MTLDDQLRKSLALDSLVGARTYLKFKRGFGLMPVMEYRRARAIIEGLLEMVRMDDPKYRQIRESQAKEGK